MDQQGNNSGTGRPRIIGRPFQPGPDPRRGVGLPGRSGRKSLPFKELCLDILEDEKTQEAIRTAAQNPESPGFATLIKMLASYTEGLPSQRVDINILVKYLQNLPPDEARELAGLPDKELIERLPPEVLRLHAG